MYSGDKFRVIELFGGIGACTKALKRLGVDVDVVDYVEIDRFAVQSYNAINGTNFKPQDITEWHKHFDDIDLIMHGSPCFVAGTKILTEDGYRNIEDIQVGDSVLTHTGKYQKVLKTGHNEHKQLYLVKAQGIMPTYATGNHPYYVITRTGYLDSESRRYEYRYSEPHWKPVEELTTQDYVAIPKLNIKKRLPKLDETVYWLLGQYVANGHIRYNKRNGQKDGYDCGVVYSIDNAKLDEFREHLDHYHTSIYPHTESVHRVVINSQELANFIMYSGFGMCAAEKDIPNFILRASNKYAKAFLDGYMFGNGHVCGDICTATAVNQNVALKLQLLVAKVYGTCAKVYSGTGQNPHIVEGRVINQRDTYQINYSKEVVDRVRYFVSDDYVWVPVKGVTKTNMYETVYNLEVAEDNSYIANNAVVHNCQDFSIAGKQAGGDEGSGSRSSLMYETLRIVEDIRPKYVLWENVKNLLSDKHIHNYRKYQFRMEALGYNNYSAVLNAKDYGLPQNRERVFTLSVRKDVDCGYQFPAKQPLTLRLKDILEQSVDEKYYLPDRYLDPIIDTLVEASADGKG